MENKGYFSSLSDPGIPSTTTKCWPLSELAGVGQHLGDRLCPHGIAAVGVKCVDSKCRMSKKRPSLLLCGSSVTNAQNKPHSLCLRPDTKKLTRQMVPLKSTALGVGFILIDRRLPSSARSISLFRCSIGFGYPVF
jgi:hypothetical protein